MKRLVLGLVLVLLCGGAAAEWVLVSFAAAKGGMDTYIDPTTIRNSGNVVKMWDMDDFKTTQVSPSTGKQYLSQKTHGEYDCNAERYRVLYFTWHAGNMGGGDAVVIMNTPSSNWAPVAPGSVGESLWKRACGKP